MSDMFDAQNPALYNAIGSDNSDNTVGSVYPGIYPDPSVIGSDSSNTNPSTTDSTNTLGNRSFADTLLASAKKTYGDGSGNKYADSALGQSFYNSPPAIAQRYMELGHYFKGAENGNEYTNHFISPTKRPAPTSEDPNTFYNKWYNNMREFAEAEEVSTRGQPQVKSR